MIRLGIIGTGGMAHSHARAFSGLRGVKVVAACDVVDAKVREFCDTFAIPAGYTGFESMLRDTDLDAVSVVTTDAAHAPASLAAIRAGKHVLCEKPLAVNYPDARKMAREAARRKVINMVNFSYRNAPAIHKAHAMVRAGDIGTPMHVEASYLQCWLACDVWGDWRTNDSLLWRLSTRHGSKGALGDIGVHILDFASYPVGDIARLHCRLKTFPKDTGKRLGEYVLDANDSAIISLEFKNGALGTVTTTRWATGQANSLLLAIFGDKGAIRIDLDDAYDTLRFCRGTDGVATLSNWKTVKCPKTPSIYKRFIRSIQTGANDQPDFSRGARIQKALDCCFVSDAEDRTVNV